MTDVIIRPATPDDRSALGRFGAALMHQHHEFDPQRFIEVRKADVGYGRFLVSQLKEDDAVVLVAERDGVVIGYAYAALEPMNWNELRGPCGCIHDVYVDDDARGAHVGEKLVHAAIAALQEKGAPRVILSTAAKNDRAQRFFARLGFRPTMIEMTRERS